MKLIMILTGVLTIAACNNGGGSQSEARSASAKVWSTSGTGFTISWDWSAFKSNGSFYAPATLNGKKCDCTLSTSGAATVTTACAWSGAPADDPGCSGLNTFIDYAHPDGNTLRLCMASGGCEFFK